MQAFWQGEQVHICTNTFGQTRTITHNPRKLVKSRTIRSLMFLKLFPSPAVPLCHCYKSSLPNRFLSFVGVCLQIKPLLLGFIIIWFDGEVCLRGGWIGVCKSTNLHLQICQSTNVFVQVWNHNITSGNFKVNVIAIVTCTSTKIHLADPQPNVFSKSANLLHLCKKTTTHVLFKAKSINPKT